MATAKEKRIAAIKKAFKNSGIKLTPRLYKLMKDVENPAVDRRRRHGWEYEAVFEAGQVYEVGEYVFTPIQGKTYPPRPRIKRIDGSGFTSWVFIDDDGQFEALAPHLKPVGEPKVTHILQNDWPHASDVLQHLVDKGRISIDDVTQAKKDLEDAEEEFYEQQE